MRYSIFNRCLANVAFTLLFVVTQLCAKGVFAADRYWVYGSGDYYSISAWEAHPTNYFGTHSPPGANDRAIYDSGGTVRLEFGSTAQNVENQTVIVQGKQAQVNLNLLGKEYKVNGNAFSPGRLRVTNGGSSGALNVVGTLYVGDLQYWGSYGRNVQVDSGGRVQAGAISLNSYSKSGGESFDLFDGTVDAGTLYLGSANTSGTSTFNLNSSSSDASFGTAYLGWTSGNSAGGNLNVLSGNLEVTNLLDINSNSSLNVYTTETVNVRALNAGGQNSPNSRINLGNNAVLKVSNGMNLGTGASIDLEHSVLDTSGTTVTGSATLTGHGVYIGNTAGLSIASPDGAVDTSYAMNIGSRRADIFSNSTATLRGDVSLTNGGQLNSNQSLVLSGNTFTQSGGTTRVLDRIRFIDGAEGTVSGGTMHASSHIQLGNQNSTGTLHQTGGTIITEKYLIVGSEGTGVYKMSGGTLNVNTPGDIRVLVIGDGDGFSSNGSVIQTGGIINAHEVRLANHATANASYSMQNGTLNTSRELRVGYRGTASMNQTGGTANIGTEVVVGTQAGSIGTYHISGGTLNTGTLSGASDPDLEVGFEGTGTFNQLGGTVTVADELVIGHRSTGDGTVNLSGGTLNVNKDSGTGVYIGHRGTGELVVSGTGQLITASVIGLGTDAGGTGTITQNGGVITTSSDVFVSSAAGSGGSHYQMNAGTLNANRLLVGQLATATYQQTGGDVNLTDGFHVNNGSTATIQNGTIDAGDGYQIGLGGSSGILQQSGGTLTGEGQFIVGSAGNGTFNMSGGTVSINADKILLVGHQDGNGTVNQSGGIISAGEVRLSNANNSVGTYNLSDGTINIADGGVVNIGHFNDAQFDQTGGTINAQNGSVIVGNYGDSTFTQTAGTVNASSVVVAQQAGSTSSYSLQGGTLNADSLSYGAGTGTFELAGGTLNVTDVTLPTLMMTSGLLDIGTLHGDLNMSGGVLAPGDSPGITTINGDYLLSGGTLEMEIAGLMQGTEYDFLDINGDWTITGGDLQLMLLGGFMPMAGNSFDLFDFNSLTGTFDNIFLPTLGSGLTWNTSNLYTTGTIGVSGVAAVPEPSTFGCLAAVGAIAGIRLRRRRTRSTGDALGKSARKSEPV